MNTLIQNQIKKIVSHNKETESCGLILNDTVVFPCRNAALNKKNNFQINEKDYLKASLRGQITACYHTHIGEIKEFSMRDRITSVSLKIPMILYHVPSDTFYSIKNDNLSYLSHPFEYEKNDCYTLVRDYYQKELNINLPKIINYNDFFAHFEDNIKETYEKYGFKKVGMEEIRKHDILLFNFYRTITPPHFAIYLGNGYILHHPRNGYSQIEKLTPILIKKFICGLQCNI